MSAHARINEASLEALRAKVGVEVSREAMPNFTEVNADSARLFAFAIGDDNPLWLDRDHARKAGFPGVLAPPAMLYAADNVVSGAVEGLPGVHAMFAGTDWTWHRRLEDGTKIRSKSRLKDLVEHQTRFAGRAIQQIYTTEFHDQDGGLLASADSWCFRTERDSAREQGTKYREIEKPHSYSKDELAEIAEHYRNEKRRGAEPRFWEDVTVGDSVSPIVKGPYTVTAAVAFMQAWGAYALRNHRIAFKYYDRHPKLASLNSMGVPEPPVRVHWDNDFAREVGVPGAYDFGPERVSWLSHMMTDWIGDAGFLVNLNAQIRGHNLVGDTTWCGGQVTGKRIEGDKALVDCSIWGRNQRDQKTIVGSATAALPRRQS
ncbi:MAG: MaoC family dehydratase N-terminal domain-containing protein [Alphaproteobacteria bacterium]